MHLVNFINICKSFDNPGVGQNAIFLRLFPLSLFSKTTIWLNKLAVNFITNWRKLKRAFLERFFLLSRMLQLRDEINNFKKLPNEALHETWMQFKKKLTQCPNHKMTDKHLMETFYRALNSITKPTVDNKIGGAFIELTFNEAADMLEQLTKTSRAWHIRDSVVASPTMFSGISMDQLRKEEERE